MTISRISVSGVPVTLYESPGVALEDLCRRLRERRRFVACAANPEKVVHSIRGAFPVSLDDWVDIGALDGVGVQMILRLHGVRIPRIRMPELALQAAVSTGSRVLLFGAGAESNEAAVLRLRQEHPALNVCGINGYESLERVKEFLSGTEFDLILVGLGSPRQEVFAFEAAQMTSASIVCCGGAIDIIAGVKRKAPALIQGVGLEWAYRLVTEPWRIKRYGALLKFLRNATRLRVSSPQ